MTQLDPLRQKPKSLWTTHLKSHGVVYPTGKSRELALLCLFDHYKKPINQDQISDWFRAHSDSIRYDRQARHLAADGWYLISGNNRSTRMESSDELNRDQLMLLDIEQPNPIWLKYRKNARLMKLSHRSWTDMLQAYKARGCSVCGRQMSHYDQGHLDPLQPLTIQNCAPMCVDCNNWAQSKDVTFEVDSRTLIARPLKFGRTV